MCDMIVLYKLNNLENYYITKNGDVYSKHGEDFKHMKPYLLGKYLAVRLTLNRNAAHYYIHRLLSETFIPNPDNKPCVDHINTDPLDNRLDNLRWVTYKENSNNELSKVNYLKSNRKKAENNFIYSPDIIPKEIKVWDNSKNVLERMSIGEIYSVSHKLAKIRTIAYACNYGRNNLGYDVKYLNLSDKGLTLIKRIK